MDTHTTQTKIEKRLKKKMLDWNAPSLQKSFGFALFICTKTSIRAICKRSSLSWPQNYKEK